VREAVSELGIDAEVVKEDVFSGEAERLGIMMTPATVIDGRLVKSGGVPTKDEVKKSIENLIDE